MADSGKLDYKPVLLFVIALGIWGLLLHQLEIDSLPGRYQMQSRGPMFIVIDTQTGEVKGTTNAADKDGDIGGTWEHNYAETGPGPPNLQKYLGTLKNAPPASEITGGTSSGE